jgi:anti-sigma-K factor RskA
VRTRCESDLKQAERELVERAEAVALLARGSTRVVQLGPQVPAPGPRAVAIVNLDEKRGVLVADGLAAKPGGDYELWVIKGGEKKAAGLLRGTPDRPLYARIDPELLAGGVDALAVTFEPPGGGKTPRGPIVIVGALPKI